MATAETYNTIADVDTFADDNGFVEWRSLPLATKKRALVEATKDIERYHKQANLDNTLWQPDESELETAANYQAVYVAKHLSLRDLSDRITHIGGGGSFNDKNLSVNGTSHRPLDPNAKLWVDRLLLRFGIRSNSFHRA